MFSMFKMPSVFANTKKQKKKKNQKQQLPELGKASSQNDHLPIVHNHSP